MRKLARDGILQCIRTPGGYRRYSIDSINEFIEKKSNGIMCDKQLQRGGGGATNSCKEEEGEQQQPIKKRKLHTQESVQEIKKTTSKDKFDPYEENFQSAESYLTSRRVSTSKGRGYVPFWNLQCKEISNNLWLPIETDLQDLGMISLNGSSIGTGGGFALSVKVKRGETMRNFHRTQNSLLQSSQSSPVESKVEDDMENEREELMTMEEEKKEEKKKPQLKMEKVKIYPTKEQRNWLIKIQHNLRALQNAAINEVKSGNIQVSDIVRKMLTPVTARGVSTENIVAKRLPEDQKEKNKHINKWTAIDSTPVTLRKNALRALQTDWFNKLKQVNNGTLSHFEKHFLTKNKKSGKVNIYLEAQTFSKSKPFDDEYIYMFTKTVIGTDVNGQDIYFSKMKYKMQGSKKQRKTLPNPRLHDCQILYEEPNRWYLLIPHDHEYENISNTGEKIKDISIDPGERGFLNFYSNDAKMVGTIDLYNRRAKLREMLDKIKHMQSKRAKCTNKKPLQKKYWRERFLRAWRKIKDIKLDLHRKVVHFLVNNFEDICIGDFGSAFVQKQKKLRKTVRKNFSFLSHFEFRKRLSQYTTVKTITVVNESYTTQTCCRCGALYRNIGSSEVYKCKTCKIKLGRDDNASVCIRIKHQSGQGHVV